MLKLQRLHRDGSSTVVTVPAPILRHLKWRRGDFVAVAVEGDRLVCRRIDEAQLLTGARRAAVRGAAEGR